MEGTGKHRMRSMLERRQIVEETFQAGASVSRVAREHDINANQLFHWRKLYRDGRLEVEETTNSLIPVTISTVVQKVQPIPRRKSKATRTGIIDIDLGHARVRIEGAADLACVRAALEGLLR
jgi:transposase